MNYKQLRAIDVTPFIEQKGKLNYISWANALDLLLQQDPMATWDFLDVVYYNETAMVGCDLHVFDKRVVMQLPVLTNNNQPIKNPNAFDINRAQMRCLTKAIAAGTAQLPDRRSSGTARIATSCVNRADLANLRQGAHVVCLSQRVDQP